MIVQIIIILHHTSVIIIYRLILFPFIQKNLGLISSKNKKEILITWNIQRKKKINQIILIWIIIWFDFFSWSYMILFIFYFVCNKNLLSDIFSIYFFILISYYSRISSISSMSSSLLLLRWYLVYSIILILGRFRSCYKIFVKKWFKTNKKI